MIREILLPRFGLTISFLWLPCNLWGTKNTYSYDAVGNLRTRAGQNLTYNSQNKLIEADSPLGTGQYTYKDSGSRLQKRFALASNPGPVTELLNLTRLMTQQTKSAAGRGSVNHIYVNGVRLSAMGIDSSGNPAIRYYHTDQVSSVKLTTDGKADALVRHEYRPYGEEFASPKFNSQEHDKESGSNSIDVKPAQLRQAAAG